MAAKPSMIDGSDAARIILRIYGPTGTVARQEVRRFKFPRPVKLSLNQDYSELMRLFDGPSDGLLDEAIAKGWCSTCAI
jgi:hypothetical protein